MESHHLDSDTATNESSNTSTRAMPGPLGRGQPYSVIDNGMVYWTAADLMSTLTSPIACHFDIA